MNYTSFHLLRLGVASVLLVILALVFSNLLRQAKDDYCEPRRSLDIRETIMAAYQGPVLPGQDASTFYKTGIDPAAPTAYAQPGGSPQYTDEQQLANSQAGANYNPAPPTNNNPPPSAPPKPGTIPEGGQPNVNGYLNEFGNWVPIDREAEARAAEARAAEEARKAEEYKRYVDEQFSPIFGIYDQAESNLNQQYPGLISEAEAQAKASRGLLDNSKLSAQDLLSTQKQSAIQGGQNQTADQRRTLQELTQANRQRFGGSSSAGQAASEIQGREFQRNTFQIGQQTQNALQQVEQKRLEVDRTYQSSLQQLEVNTQKAKNDLQRSFQDKLLEINSGRANTASQKAAARMEALQQLRNEAYQIDMAKMQFAQQLQMQREANAAQLEAATKQFTSGVNTNTYTPTQSAPEAQSTVTTNQNDISQAVGQITPQRQEEEQLTGQMSYQTPNLLGNIMGAINPRLNGYAY